MSLVILTALFLSLHSALAIAVPKQYIVDVYAECGKTINDLSSLKILADIEIKAIARCANGNRAFKTTDNVHYQVPGSYKTVGSLGKCLLMDFKGTHKVDIEVMYGNPGGHLLSNSQIFTVSCTFDASGKVAASSSKTKPGFLSYKEKATNVGSAVTKGYIKLELQDVRNLKIAGAVPMDKWVTLYATTDGKKKEAGLKPVSCFAINSKKQRFAILRAGCGDGLVISKSIGFMTTGRTMRSPYFKSFLIEGDSSISYECTFVLCTGNCDGSSCGKV